MSTVINDVLPRVQAISTAGQVQFDTNFTADVESDVTVYARATGTDASDVTDLVLSTDYTVTFVGAERIVRVTFSVGRTLDDIVTISRETPTDRENLYTNTNFTPSMLNQDFGITTLVEQQNKLYRDEIGPRYNVSASLNTENVGNSTATTDLILPVLEADQIWVMNDDRSAIRAETIPAGGISPATATYITQVPTLELNFEQALSNNPDGFMTSRTIDGVVTSRTLTGTASQIDVSNGTGNAGNPIFKIADDPTLPGTGFVLLPQGSTAARPAAGTAGRLRYNTDIVALEYDNGTDWIEITHAPLDQTYTEITQASHGFSVGNWIRTNGTDTYTLAQADSAENAEVIGVVTRFIDANNFEMGLNGFITGLSGLVANTVYFLSTSIAGAITSVEPTADGQVSKPVLNTTNTTSGYMFTYRGEVIGGALTGAAPVTSTFLTETNELASLPNSSLGVVKNKNQASFNIQLNDTLGLTSMSITDSVGTQNVNVNSLGLYTGKDMLLAYTSLGQDDGVFKVTFDAAGFGDASVLNMNHITGALAADSIQAVQSLSVDSNSAVAGSYVFGSYVTNSGDNAIVTASFAGAGVNPVAQSTGVFGNLTKFEIEGVDYTTEANSPTAADLPYFAGNGDVIIVSKASKFSEVDFTQSTGASITIKPIFEYWDGAWQVFSPVDGTNGFQNENGIISWQESALTGWVVDANTNFSIRITRDQNSVPTIPVGSQVQIASTIAYFWNSAGEIGCNNLLVDSKVGFSDDSRVRGITFDAPSNVPVTYNVEFPADPPALGDTLVITAGGASATSEWAPGGGSSERTETEVNQVGHSFVAGQVLRHNGTIYVLSKADTAINAEVYGVVESVTDVDNFTLTTAGRSESFTGLTIGECYYLDPVTAGAITSTEPTTIGQISKPVVCADTATSGVMLTMRGIEVGTTALNGIIQIVDATDIIGASTTTIIPVDNTIPQNTEGAEFITVTITPTSATSKLLIEFEAGIFTNDVSYISSVALFQDSTVNALKAIQSGGNYPTNLFYFSHLMTAGTTSATTFKIRFGPNNALATAYAGTTSAGHVFGAAHISSIRVTEIQL